VIVGAGSGDQPGVIRDSDRLLVRSQHVVGTQHEVVGRMAWPGHIRRQVPSEIPVNTVRGCTFCELSTPAGSCASDTGLTEMEPDTGDLQSELDDDIS